MSVPRQSSVLSSHATTHYLLTLITHCLYLVIGCLCAHLPLACYFANQVGTRAVFFILLHIVVLVLALYWSTKHKLSAARTLLLSGYASYLSVASMVWPDQLGLYYFFLLGTVACGFLFRHREIIQQRGWALTYTALFIVFDLVAHNGSHSWQAQLHLANSITLALACLLVLFTLQWQSDQRWQQLTSLTKETQSVLATVLPPSPNTTEGTWRTGETRRLAQVSVIFADLQGYLSLSEQYEDEQIVTILDMLYRQFDQIASQFGIARLKTNGDEYMAVAGLPDPAVSTSAKDAERVYNMCAFACALRTAFTTLCRKMALPCQVRIGIATGPVTAGIIGMQRPAFDIWGRTVNLAARLEQSATPGHILICEQTAATILSQPQWHISPADCALKGLKAKPYELSEH